LLFAESAPGIFVLVGKSCIVTAVSAFKLADGVMIESPFDGFPSVFVSSVSFNEGSGEIFSFVKFV
jgi:hypothetical protein